jgi:hypothetical protein
MPNSKRRSVLEIVDDDNISSKSAKNVGVIVEHGGDIHQ